MSWVEAYAFREPLVDLRRSEHAETFTAELRREVADGHPLYGRSSRVVARALPNDDVVVECGDDVAVVHLTWTQRPEAPPWPLTTFVASAEELESYAESEYGWSADAG